MAIAYDTGTFSQAATATSLTFAHTCTGSNGMLFVMGSDKSGTNTVVTGVTYNAVAMQRMGHLAGSGTANDRAITLWALPVPSTGSNNVVVSASESVSLRFSAVSYAGVRGAIPGPTDTSVGNAVASISTDITTTLDDCWMLMFSKDNDGGKTQSSSTGDTSRLVSDAGGHSIFDTGEVIASAGANTMTIGWTGNVNIGSLAVAFSPFLGGIAFDAVGSSSDVTSDTQTFSHTCTGSDLILWVGWWQASTGVTATSVTYNGDAMTATSNSPYDPGTGRHYLYYLVNPDTGTHDVVITLSGSTVIRSDSASYTGVKQSGQPDAVGSNTTASGTTLTTSVTVVAENSWIFGNARENVNGNTAASDHTKQRESGGNTTSSGFDSGGGLEAGSKSLIFTTTGSATRLSMIAASFAPVASTAVKDIIGGYIPHAR